MSLGSETGTCITGKVRYQTEADAATALTRVREARRLRPDGHAPERIFYPCGECDGWHLSSRLPKFETDGPQPKQSSETWEEYAHRLERRVFQQRQHIDDIHALREEGNRHARKKIEGLTAALGRMTARWEKEREQRQGLVEHLRELRAHAPEDVQATASAESSVG